jgi:hypothetical protein
MPRNRAPMAPGRFGGIQARQASSNRDSEAVKGALTAFLWAVGECSWHKETHVFRIGPSYEPGH